VARDALRDRARAEHGRDAHAQGDLEIAFDLVEHRLELQLADGRAAAIDLTAQPACADVYGPAVRASRRLGVAVDIHPAAFDLGDSPALSEDRVNATYDPDAVTRWWRTLAATQRVLDRLRSDFAGKASPVHLFWHSFDLAHARFSGARPAGDVDPITAEAYSHEVVAFGFWPGDDRRTPFPAFYSYTAPEPDGLAEQPLVDGAAWHDTGNGSLAILPYDAVREAGDPDEHLLASSAPPTRRAPTRRGGTSSACAASARRRCAACGCSGPRREGTAGCAHRACDDAQRTAERAARGGHGLRRAPGQAVQPSRLRSSTVSGSADSVWPGGRR
jgi:hypothetical protein